MRQSLLSLIVVGALTSWAVPGLAAQQQRVEHYAPNGTSGVAAEGTFFTYYLGDPPSVTELPNCTAGSAKDVGRNKNKCEPYPR
jgi:hypothetical protein